MIRGRIVSVDDYKALLRELHLRIRSTDPDCAAKAESLTCILDPVCCEGDLLAYFEVASQARLPELIARIWLWAAEALELLHGNGGAAAPAPAASMKGLHAVHKLVSMSLDHYDLAAKVLVEKATKDASAKGPRAISFAKKFESAGCLTALMSLVGKLNGAGVGDDGSITGELQSRVSQCEHACRCRLHGGPASSLTWDSPAEPQGILLSFVSLPLPYMPLLPPQLFSASGWMLYIWGFDDNNINKSAAEPLQDTLSGIHALCAAAQRRQQDACKHALNPSVLASTLSRSNYGNVLSTHQQMNLSMLLVCALHDVIADVVHLTQGLVSICEAFLGPHRQQKPQGRDGGGGGSTKRRQQQHLEAAMMVRCAAPCLAVLVDYMLRVQLQAAYYDGIAGAGSSSSGDAAVRANVVRISVEASNMLAVIRTCIRQCWPWNEALVPASEARELHGILHDCLRLRSLPEGKHHAVEALMALHGA